MSDLWRLRTLGYLGLWLLIAATLILARLLPLPVPADAWPRPDMLLPLTLAWVLRRPSHLPALAIGLMFLAEDLFVMRPPGLWALIVLAGTEFLRRRQSAVREMHIALEWGMVSAVMLVMYLANRIGLAIVMTPREPLDLSLTRLIFTILIYPLVVLVLQSVIRVRKPATGEVDELGRKL